MIKVNLLRNMGATPAAGGLSAGEVVSTDTKRQAGIKLVALVLLPLGLFIWEKYNLSGLNTEVAVLQAQVTKLQKQISSLGDISPRVEKYTAEKKKIDGELEILRKLSKNRLREVKALDALQSLLPQRTWLRSIEIEGNLIRMKGNTSSAEGVSELIRELERSAYFSGVLPKSTYEEVLSTGPSTGFEVEVHVGKTEQGKI